MSLFASRGLAKEPIPPDENDVLVNEIRDGYPFGQEAVGLRAFIRVAVYVVLEMKKRGLI